MEILWKRQNVFYQRTKMNILVDFYCDNNLGDDLMGEALIDFLSERGHKCFFQKRDLFVMPEFIYKKSVIIIEMVSERTVHENAIELYIKIGGSMFPHGTNKEGIYRYYELIKILNLKKMKMKVCIINCNIGPLRKKIGLYATKKILKNADLITCRDNETFNFVGNRDNLFFYPDVVFGINKRNEKVIGENIIGISVYMGYAPYLKMSNGQYVEFLANFINLYHKKYSQQKFVLFSFDSGYNSDLPMAAKVLGSIRKKENVKIVSYCNLDDFILEYKKCKFILGTRFHSIVLAIKYNIPFLAISYSNKTDNLMNYLNINRYLKISECNQIQLDSLIEYVQNGIKGNVIDIEKIKMDSKKHFDELESFLHSLN